MAAPAVGVVGGWLLDRAVGDPQSWHPVAGLGLVAEAIERRWWRDTRLAGSGYAAVLVGVPTALAAAAEARLARRPAARAAVLAAAVATSVGARCLGEAARGVARAVAAGDLGTARAGLPALCGRDPADLDGAGLCRAAIESVAENTSDAVVAPLWWAALAGTPGVVAHRVANTLDAMVGDRSARHARFGTAAARLDDALGWVPARLTAALTVAAAPAVGGSPRAALAAWRRDGRRHPSPNAGRCEAASAGALDVGLGGAHTYPGGTKPGVTGPFGGARPPSPADVDRAVRLSLLVGLLATLLCAALAAARTPAARTPAPRAASAPRAAKLCVVGRGSATTRPQFRARRRARSRAVRRLCVVGRGSATTRPQFRARRRRRRRGRGVAALAGGRR